MIQRTTLAALLLLAFAVPALATAQRTFVSSTGTDSNPCSRDLPCRTFAAAIAQTNANGEVVAIDSAGYGPVSVTQSVTIVAPIGVHAGISVFSGDGVHVDAGAGIVVLRNLYINAQGGTNGINLVSADTLHIESCTVNGFSNNDINLVTAATSRTVISDTVVRHAGQYGIYVNSPTYNYVVITHSRADSNHAGVVVDEAFATIDHLVATGNSGPGVSAQGLTSGAAAVSISSSTVSDNGEGLLVGNGMLTAFDVTADQNQTAFYVGGFGAATGTMSLDHCSAGVGTNGVEALVNGHVTIAQSVISEMQYGIWLNSGTVRMSGTTVTNSGTGIHYTSGTFASTGDNVLTGNTTDKDAGLTIVPISKT